MMSDDRRKFYVRQHSAKQGELAAIEIDLESCGTKKQELRLRNDAERILKEIEDLNEKLKGIETESDTVRVRITALDATLKKIDFKPAREIAAYLNKTFETQDCGFALLLLQRTVKQMGEMCLSEMLEMVFGRDMQEVLSRKQNDRGDGACKVYTADMASVAGGGTSVECLRLLAGYEGQSLSYDPVRLGEEFRRSFCQALRSGDRVLILVKDWHYVEPQIFLRWFVEEFWQPLVAEVRRCVVPKYGRIKVVAVLASGGAVPVECLSEVPFCTLDSSNAFEPHHLIDIPLPDWTVEDIQNWLMEVKKMEKADSLIQAQRLHADSDGTPQVVCSILKERYSA
jgi:hypothetical protein